MTPRMTKLCYAPMASFGLSLVLATIASAQVPVKQELPPAALTVTDSRDATEAGAPGLALSVVGRTVGVPAVLHAARGTARAPLAAVLVENTGTQTITRLALAVSWVPPDGSARRQVVAVTTTIAPGTTTRVSLRELPTIQALVGVTGVLEVALTGVSYPDGRRAAGSPGMVWATLQTQIACADGQWQAYAKDTEMADQATGTLVRCAADGQWRPLDGVDAEREQ